VGTRNRERRRAKQKARQKKAQQRNNNHQGWAGFGASAGWAFGASAGSPSGERFDTGPRPAQVVEHLVGAVVHAIDHRHDDVVQSYCELLVHGMGGTGGPQAVDAALTGLLQRDTDKTWQRGWQPADVVRMAQREYGARHARVTVDAIAAQMRAYPAATVDERWTAQLRDLGATVWWERDDQYLRALGEREGLARPELIRCVLEVLYVFSICPQIQMLCPPPGQGQARSSPSGAAAADGAGCDERQLDRIRALLAKAESTNFPEEAETYTAKAQELMARYSIDQALLSAGTGAREQPLGRRVGVDNPYEAPKVLLLDAVARANRCRSVWSKAFGFVTVLGFPPDVDAVELLFTSLLVQATTAMVRAGSRRDAYGRSSTRSFRQSFLVAYAQRIGERLSMATREATEQASQAMAGQPGARQLLPVLASREKAVGSLTEELFPDLGGHSVAVTNREGWAHGRAAADQAHLNVREEVVARP
jgi:hypothetical protein